MSHTCESCEDEFPTLTRKRLHQRDDCPGADEEVDISNLDVDEQAELVVEKLLVCDICESQNDHAEAIDKDVTDAGLSVTLTFECSACGAHNENTGILGGDGRVQ